MSEDCTVVVDVLEYGMASGCRYTHTNTRTHAHKHTGLELSINAPAPQAKKKKIIKMKNMADKSPKPIKEITCSLSGELNQVP